MFNQKAKVGIFRTTRFIVHINRLLSYITVSGLFLAAFPASAITIGEKIIQANADAQVGYPPMAIVTDSDVQVGSLGTVAANASAQYTGNHFWSSASATDGGILISSSRGEPNGQPGSSSSVARWSTTYTNTESTPRTYMVNFLIYGGMLDAFDIGALLNQFDFVEAGYSARITVNDSTIFNSEGRLRREGPSIFNPWTFSETGTSLGGVFVGDLSSGRYSWNDNSISMIFGTFAPGESFLVTYELGTDVYLPQHILVEEGPYAMSLRAEFNDPLGISAINSSSVTPVPLPAALWLFGSGLLGLVGIARRRRGPQGGGLFPAVRE